jgi:hypothetical protein
LSARDTLAGHNKPSAAIEAARQINDRPHTLLLFTSVHLLPGLAETREAPVS